jgi:hypothetical protein
MAYLDISYFAARFNAHRHSEAEIPGLFLKLWDLIRADPEMKIRRACDCGFLKVEGGIWVNPMRLKTVFKVAKSTVKQIVGIPEINDNRRHWTWWETIVDFFPIEIPAIDGIPKEKGLPSDTDEEGGYNKSLWNCGGFSCDDDLNSSEVNNY